ncbi:MAG: alpha/beta hydrolase [Anaerolineaceae bacterium]|nr:alpha/beta hydrolase [Anaerolineaceae bacterium]
MQDGTFNFKTNDGLTLLGRVWQTTGTPKGIINLVHGLGEHSGRYAHIAEAFTKSGYNLISFDLRGHGLSEGKKGHTPDYEHIMDDVALFMQKSNDFFGKDHPNFLYGHSLGGTIVLNYALRRKPELAGVISTDPALRLSFEPPKIKLMLGKVMADLMPSFSMTNSMDYDALSRDAAIVQAYKDDVLVHYMISAKLVMELFNSGKYAMEHAKDWSLPLLLMHGSDDRISSCQASEEFAKLAGDSVTFRKWEGYYHEIHNDIGKEEVITCMIEWLDSHI